LEKAPDAFRTISEVADELDVPQHVLRFWESRFRDIKPMKRGGGRRYYRPEDINLLRGIRHLLYGEGYTIRGVQRILKEHDADGVLDDVDVSNAASPPAHEAVERGRGLLALLPALLGDTDEDDALPPAAGRSEPHLGAKSPRPLPATRNLGPPSLDRLARDELRKLQAALHDLGECRKLLAAALNPQA
jgi:DNA-binding transcriptional MerR regulator